MLATKTHPACTVHKDRMWLPLWLDKKTVTHTKISPKWWNAQIKLGTQKKKKKNCRSQTLHYFLFLKSLSTEQSYCLSPQVLLYFLFPITTAHTTEFLSFFSSITMLPLSQSLLSTHKVSVLFLKHCCASSSTKLSSTPQSCCPQSLLPFFFPKLTVLINCESPSVTLTQL